MEKTSVCAGRGAWSPNGWVYTGRVGVPIEDVVQIVRRSSLFVPANMPKFVEKAWTRGADTILLDLEDSVALSQKNAARAVVKDDLPVVVKGGAEVMVRINKPFAMAVADLDACIWPGLAGVRFPKAESGQEIRVLDLLIAERELARDIPRGTIQVHASIETALGLHNVQAIAAASPRLVSISFGAEDYARDMEIEPSSDGRELFLGKMQILLAARLAGIQACGLMASIADFKDIERVVRLVREARSMGFKGSTCIHPAQVQPLNEGFSFTPEEIEHARKVIAALDAAEAEGRDSVAVDGKMVDIPVADRARRLLARAEAIARVETRKRSAMEANNVQ
jgi:citrate lyase subunit beta / citryl-CoA lyase